MRTDEQLNKIVDMLYIKLKQLNIVKFQSYIKKLLNVEDGKKIFSLLQEKVIENGDLAYLNKFSYAEGADLNRIGKKILDSNNTYWIYTFARYRLFDKTAYQNAILNSQNEWYTYLLALSGRNFDIQKLEDGICEYGSSESLYYYAKNIEDADYIRLARKYLSTNEITFQKNDVNIFYFMAVLDALCFDDYLSFLDGIDGDPRNFYELKICSNKQKPSKLYENSSIVLMDDNSVDEDFIRNYDSVRKLSDTERYNLIENLKINIANFVENTLKKA